MLTYGAMCFMVLGMAADTPLGTRIRRARERLRMSQEELGAAVKASRSAVNSWEKGRAEPRNKTVVEDVLGISLDEDAPEPKIPAGLQRMVDALSDEEREALLAELTGRPAAPAPRPRRRGRESA